MVIKDTELEKRIRDTPKYERYLYNIMQGFSILDSWNMAMWPKDYEERRRKKIKNDKTRTDVGKILKTKGTIWCLGVIM